MIKPPKDWAGIRTHSCLILNSDIFPQACMSSREWRTWVSYLWWDQETCPTQQEDLQPCSAGTASWRVPAAQPHGCRGWMGAHGPEGRRKMTWRVQLSSVCDPCVSFRWLILLFSMTEPNHSPSCPNESRDLIRRFPSVNCREKQARKDPVTARRMERKTNKTLSNGTCVLVTLPIIRSIFQSFQNKNALLS